MKVEWIESLIVSVVSGRRSAEWKFCFLSGVRARRAYNAAADSEQRGLPQPFSLVSFINFPRAI